MKFFVKFTPIVGKNIDAMTRFANWDLESGDAMMESMGIKVLAQYFMTEGGGFMVAEAESSSAITVFTTPWTDLMEMEISTVVDREEAQATAKQVVSIVSQMA